MAPNTDEDDDEDESDAPSLLGQRAAHFADQLVDEFGADSCVILVTHYDRTTCISSMDYSSRGNKQACIGSVERYRRIMHQ